MGCTLVTHWISYCIVQVTVSFSKQSCSPEWIDGSELIRPSQWLWKRALTSFLLGASWCEGWPQKRGFRPRSILEPLMAAYLYHLTSISFNWASYVGLLEALACAPWTLLLSWDHQMSTATAKLMILHRFVACLSFGLGCLFVAPYEPYYQTSSPFSCLLGLFASMKHGLTSRWPNLQDSQT